MSLQQVWHNYELWEDYQNGMWRAVTKEEQEQYLKQAIDFTGNADLYGSFMLRVIKEWPISCEHNLTCMNLNRQAWVGHAACCLAIGCPEDITRMAWHCLTQEQQDKANSKADQAISEWEKEYIIKAKNKTIQLELF